MCYFSLQCLALIIKLGIGPYIDQTNNKTIGSVYSLKYSDIPKVLFTMTALPIVAQQYDPTLGFHFCATVTQSHAGCLPP